MPLFNTIAPLVLASGSPRRQELLSSVGLNYEVHVSPSEAEPLPGEFPPDYACRAAEGKAKAVLHALGGAFTQGAVLAADTIVVLDNEILGKPKSHAHALTMLQKLAGRTHTVITACCLLVCRNGSLREERFYLQSNVSMWDAPEKLLKAYAYSDEPMDKAGAYAVQGSGGFLARAIEGSWSNVVGLPLGEVLEALLKHEIITPADIAPPSHAK